MQTTQLLKDFYKANFQKAGIDPILADELIDSLISNLEDKKIRSKIQKVFKKAFLQLKNPISELDIRELIDFSDVKVFLDVGANQLGTLNWAAEKYPAIERLVGVDMIHQKRELFDPKRCEYYQLDLLDNPLPLKNSSVDLVNIQFVLHHFPDLESINYVLAECKRVLKPNGRLILWEESFEENVENEKLGSMNEKLGIPTNIELTTRFYNLSIEERIKFIKLNDKLINAGNPHMPWFDQYRSFEEWSDILGNFGFKLEKNYNLGLRVNGRMRNGVHIIGVFNNRLQQVNMSPIYNNYVIIT
jgi:SAM-dependent methyltransferase